MESLDHAVIEGVGATPAAGGGNEDLGPLTSYLYVLSNKQTQTDYLIRLGYFFDYLQITGKSINDRATKFVAQAQSDNKWANNYLTGFVSYLKNDNTRKLSGATIKNYFAAVKLFYEANNITLNWKWIAKGLPPGSHVANDRAPTLDELRKLVEYPDRRVKVIVYVMASGGIRVGAWEYLKLKHVTPIKNDKTGQVIAAKLKVYDGLPDPYYTFISGEAYQAIQEYMAFRSEHGEKITGESWLLRDKFPTVTDKTGASRSLATNPKKLSVSSVKRTLGRALQAQNIRQDPLNSKNHERRYEFKTAHGLRKYYKSNAERVMRPLNIEMLMDHKTGISDSYYRPTEQQLLEDYLKAEPLLRINNNNDNGVEERQQLQQQQQKTETQLLEMRKEIDLLYQALQASQVMKEFDEEQKQLLIESDRYREAAKQVLEEERDEINYELLEQEETVY